jgi:type I restriction enzyme, S subunit
MFKQTLKAYNKYNSVDYDYVGQLPEGWELLPNIAVFCERISKGHTDEELLSVTIGKGIIRQTENEIKKDSSNEDKSNYKFVEEYDIAYNKMRMWQGSVGYSQYRGIVSPAYIVLKPKITINPEYYHYLLRTNFYTNYSKRFSYGIVDDQLSLRYKDFKRMYSIAPPLKTQNKIVEYLNQKTKQADTFIKKQTQFIELIKEQKKAIINKAVTKGLNPDAPMKDSGIEWLGEIPAHWEVTKIKFVAKLNPHKSESGFTKNSMDLVTFLPMENVSENGEIITELKKPIKDLWEGFTFFKKNDVLLAKITPCFENGKGAYLKELDTKIAFGTTEFHVLRAKKTILPNFLFFILRSTIFKKIGKENMVGTAGQQRVPKNFLANYRIALPIIEEQRQIVSHIQTKTKKIDQAIQQAEKEITLVKEYLQSLIYNVVIGKLEIKKE